MIEKYQTREQLKIKLNALGHFLWIYIFYFQVKVLV